MSERFEILFLTKGYEEDENLIRTYIKPTVNDLQNKGVLQSFHFFRYGGRVRLRLRGDKREILKEERGKLEHLKKEGLIMSYEPIPYRLEVVKFGKRGAEIADKLFELASIASLNFMNTFKPMEKPDPVNTFPEETREGRLPVGTWIFIHSLFNQLSYGDVGEINACFKALTNRIFSIPNIIGKKQAQEITEAIIRELKKMLEALGR
jgi:hypothetical protein